MAYFTLARKVDPNYKTNRIILLMTIAVLIVRGLFTNDWGGSLVFSGGFFLTWALAREIDPLHEKSAFVAAFIYLSMAMWVVELNLGLVFLTVLLLRGITKITGKKTTVIDLLVLTGLGVYLIIGQENGISILLPGEALQDDAFRVILLLLGLLIGTFYGMMLKKDRGIRDDLGELMETKSVLLSYIFYLLMYVVLITSTNIDQGTMSLFFAVILGVALYRGFSDRQKG